jgi:DNA-binding transcriptional MerR regulator
MSGGLDLFTLKDIAQRLNLPESTLRKYRDAYPQFIPYVGSGREKRYRAEAEEVFKAIRERRVDRHLSWEDTESELADIFPMNPDELVKRAAVSEEEANIFIEKMDRAVAKLTEQAQRQEFIVTTLANELIRIREIVEKLAPAADDIKQTRKMTYSFNESALRMLKQGQDGMAKALDMLERTQGAIYYMPGEIAARLEKMSGLGGGAKPTPRTPEPRRPDIEINPAPAAEPEAEPRRAAAPAPHAAPPAELVGSAPPAAALSGLKEELRKRDEELAKFRELYVRAKREAEKLKDDLRKKTVGDIYGKAEPKKSAAAPPPDIESADAEKGGKFFFKGRKKKQGDI